MLRRLLQKPQPTVLPINRVLGLLKEITTFPPILFPITLSPVRPTCNNESDTPQKVPFSTSSISEPLSLDHQRVEVLSFFPQAIAYDVSKTEVANPNEEREKPEKDDLEWSDVEPDNTHKPLSTPPHYSTPSFEPEPVDIIEIDPPAPATPDNNTHITSDKATNTVQFPLFPSFSTSNIHFQINNSELRYSSLSGLLISF